MRRGLSIRCHSWSADASTTTQGKANSRDNGPNCFLDGQGELPNPCRRHLDWEQKPKLRQHPLILPQSGPFLLSSLFSNLSYCKKPCLASRPSSPHHKSLASTAAQKSTTSPGTQSCIPSPFVHAQKLFSTRA